MQLVPARNGLFLQISCDAAASGSAAQAALLVEQGGSFGCQDGAALRPCEAADALDCGAGVQAGIFTLGGVWSFFTVWFSRS